MSIFLFIDLFMSLNSALLITKFRNNLQTPSSGMNMTTVALNEKEYID